MGDAGIGLRSCRGSRHLVKRSLFLLVSCLPNISEDLFSESRVGFGGDAGTANWERGDVAVLVVAKSFFGCIGNSLSPPPAMLLLLPLHLPPEYASGLFVCFTTLGEGNLRTKGRHIWYDLFNQNNMPTLTAPYRPQRNSSWPLARHAQVASYPYRFAHRG